MGLISVCKEIKKKRPKAIAKFPDLKNIIRKLNKYTFVILGGELIFRIIPTPHICSRQTRIVYKAVWCFTLQSSMCFSHSGCAVCVYGVCVTMCVYIICAQGSKNLRYFDLVPHKA